MSAAQNIAREKRRGAVLIISMIFIVMFSALAISMATMSGSNLQIAENQHQADGARACAESGLEIMRFWLNRVSIPDTAQTSQRLSQIAQALQNELTANGIANVTAGNVNSAVTIATVTLSSAKGQSFSAAITSIDAQTLQLDVTGRCGQATRTIRANFRLAQRGHTVFDFGVATKGPLSLSGNVQLDDINLSVGASVYIESQNANLALSISGNSQIAEDVFIVNPIANVDLQGGKAGIGGQTGQAAIDNHVAFGAPPVDFPAPDTQHFEQYTSNIIDSNTDTSESTTYENVRILAGTNPNFSGNITLRGVLFIESPNVVTFTGNTTITGMIVADGDVEDDSGTSQLNFHGNVVSQPVTSLPDETQFQQIRNETGTFVIAPGFRLSFTGNFTTLNGAIAGNGIEFSGNAGGTISGSIINYSDQVMTVSGNSDLYFNRSGVTQSPAGFVPQLILEYTPSSYSEVML